ncbi:MAG: AAA family ATPase [Gammaproteobacteria bacterium]
MRLARLLLHAFGPFSGTSLDFAATPATLHLVFGPNEAGKSSALRAMLDLRFGIPERSMDTFVHAARELRVAGEFVTAEGETIGLVRRKGRKETLALFDLAGGPEAVLGPAPPELEQALTGGLERGEFELMFGIDHARLRKGGHDLSQGEGELGAALFEASAGARGIANLVTALDDEAKAWFNPHARAHKAIINEARAALEQARRELREAQVRPNEWQRLSRDHDDAVAQLAEIDTSLEATRRRQNALTELRVVEPLLRRADALARELAALTAVPELAPEAREERLAALQALARARADGAAARADRERCVAALAGLELDGAVLEHADAIERLAAAAEPARRARLARRERELLIDDAREALAQDAGRIAPAHDCEDVLAGLPSAAERVVLNRHLQALAEQRLRCEGLRARQADVVAQLDDANRASAPALDGDALAALERALDAARALGDAEARLAALAGEIEGMAAEVARGVAYLDVESLDTLAAARPLLDTVIEEARERFLVVRDTRRALDDARAELIADRAEQERREQELAAGGEVITAEALSAARAERDRGWSLIRAVYIEGDMTLERARDAFDHGRPLVEAFERAQAAADHYADLLRADTERVARLGEARARIAQMSAALETNARACEERVAEETAMQAQWQDKLAAAGLPALAPDSLAEWQRRRARLLESHAELGRLREAHAQLAREVGAATAALQDTLGVSADAGDDTLAALVERGTRVAREATAARAAAAERARAGARAVTERERVERDLEAATVELRVHEEALRAWRERLLLVEGGDIEAFRARLEELDALGRDAAALRELKRAAAADIARVDDFDAAATALARLLGDAPPVDADDFADRLRRRLADAREQAQRRRDLEGEHARAIEAEQQATRQAGQQEALLARLCAAGGVDAVESLAAVEEDAARKRRLDEELAQLRRDIAAASAQPEAVLRERLQGLDSASITRELEECRETIAQAEAVQRDARGAEEAARHALAAIDDSDRAAAARETIEAQAARLRAALGPWARLRLGHALLAEALVRYRERAQGPMLAAASEYFALISGGRYVRLVTDESGGTTVLRALRDDGAAIGLEAMSEGTADQLYLALRLAALELRRAAHPDLPLVLDDVLITSDDQRAAQVFRALARFAAGGQVLLFTHHAHLVDVARAALAADALAVHRL